MTDAAGGPSVCLVLGDIGENESREVHATAVSTLVRAVARSGAGVTVLYAGRPDGPVAVALARLGGEGGVQIAGLADNPPPVGPAHMRDTVKVFRDLSARAFDVVLFQDRHALGHASVVAKTCGIAFGRTVLGVVAFGSSELSRATEGSFPHEIAAIIVEFMERRTVELADAVISRSNAITDWMAQAGWRPAKTPIAWPDASAALDVQGNWWRSTLDRLLALARRPPISIAAGEPADTTVIVAHWEQPKLVHHTLQALSAQTEKSFEVIVVDDGSSSKEALQNLDTLADRYRGLNLTLIRQSNRYVGAARNAGIRAAKTKFVIVLDDDNVPYPDMVRMLRLAAHASGADIVTCAIRQFHDQPEAPDPASPAKSLEHHFSAGPLLAGIVDNCFGDVSGIYRRDVFDRVGGFHEAYGVTLEDWQMHFRAVAAGGTLLSLPISLLWYRVRPESMLRRTRPYANFRLIASATQQVSDRALAPLADYLMGSRAELARRQAEIERLARSLKELHIDAVQSKEEVAKLRRALAQSEQLVADLQRQIIERGG
jgi:GT2 family glycosyltransferase